MRKKLGVSFFAKLFALLMCLLCFSGGIFNPVIMKDEQAISCQSMAYELPNLKTFFKKLFNKNQSVQKRSEPVYVYLGGYPLGFSMSCSGVVVIAKANESAYQIKEGDIITHIEDIAVSSAEEIYRVINSETFAGKLLNVKYVHQGEVGVAQIKPIFDVVTNAYKLGIWVRDDAAGVGTLTYIRKDNLRFGALGHPVCDIDTGTALPVAKGNIFKCNIVGYKPGEKGNPGELKGLFLRNGLVLGSLDANNSFGVYGKLSAKVKDKYCKDMVEVADRSEVKNGKAVIRSTIEGDVPKDYEIEIVKTYFQKTKDIKSMFIRVTDKELLAKTGGIVQGMSGSPIIQNGKLVGAVTHVFVSDPTKGYGVYADWMIGN